MGIPFLAGSPFEESHREDAPIVVIVNETGADRIWPGENPIGKRIAMWWGDTVRAEVVGVVADVRERGPDTEPYPMFYWDERQFNSMNLMSLVVRTHEEPTQAIVDGMRSELAALDPSLTLYDVRAMEDRFADAIRRPRLATISLGLFALVALLLAAFGRVLRGLVFGVSTADPLTLLVTVGLLATVALLAAWLPARRASGIDPAETIRTE